jgi:hypothetical protein
MALSLKDNIQMVIEHPSIDPKFKKKEQKKLDICNECPDTNDCWSCGSEPRIWW